MGQEDNELFTAYLAQNGSNMTCVVTRATANQIHHALNQGEPFGLWMRSGWNNSRLTGISINPLAGGVVFSLAPAQDVPLNSAGQPAATQAEVSTVMKASDQPKGELLTPAWVKREGLSGTKEPRAAAVPEPPRAPGPPSEHEQAT